MLGPQLCYISLHVSMMPLHCLKVYWDLDRYLTEQCPNASGRMPKYYHPLIKCEEPLNKEVPKILPKPYAKLEWSNDARLVQPWGLSKLHKNPLTRNILSAMSTFKLQNG